MNIQSEIIIYHRLTSFHRRHSPYNVICIKLYRLTKQIVHLLIAAGRIGHRQSRQDGTRAPGLASPSPMLRWRDNILNISLRNSWKATRNVSILRKNYEKVIAIIFNEKSFVLSFARTIIARSVKWNREIAKCERFEFDKKRQCDKHKLWKIKRVT